MTIDEAIQHCEEVSISNQCEECRREHKQLGDWLKELKIFRKLFSDQVKEHEENEGNLIPLKLVTKDNEA